jgi:ABC-type uncharacterized transport system permease subunit
VLADTVSRAFVGTAAAGIAAIAVGLVLVLAIGADPAAVVRAFATGTAGSWYGFGQLLFRTTSLILAGLAVVLPYRAGLFNVGAEGQIYAGSFAAACVGLFLPELPAAPTALLCVLAAAAAGALWALIPALLKAVRGVHEVISTIMLNFVAAAITNYLVVQVLGVPESLRTPALAPRAWLPALSVWISHFRGSAVNTSLLGALALVALAQLLLRRTTVGYRLRVVGHNPAAAEMHGVSVRRVWCFAMGLGGAAAGLVGANFVLGYKHYFEDGFSGGTGFVGIAVALMGAGKPWAVVPAALFMGGLLEGGLAINHLVPKEVVLVIQAVAVIAVLVLQRGPSAVRWRS